MKNTIKSEMHDGKMIDVYYPDQAEQEELAQKMQAKVSREKLCTDGKEHDMREDGLTANKCRKCGMRIQYNKKGMQIDDSSGTQYRMYR